jgi:hypothetical protein
MPLLEASFRLHPVATNIDIMNDDATAGRSAVTVTGPAA